MPAPPSDAALVSIRPRRPEDVPVLVEVLGAQQPVSLYPLVWPLPYPPEQFIVRPTEERAWAAEVDGRVVGHASIATVGDDETGRLWSVGVGRPVAELACLSVLFVDHRLTGKGVGGALMDVAVAWARSRRRTPVLDVVVRHGRAAQVYRHRGWEVIGEARPEWLPDSEPPVLLMALLDHSDQPVPQRAL
ncbi:GNAT family N-acetyltransferase [Luteipulveratus sp. YIM 133132]|uniref:GNAT family N-acetyltransferase n=1 Tax=Luteipulveratus flavus TaxID=3031728 RepID=A0ABT6C4U3_9MICO|nr:MULTISPECIES: GNAT family N-acetyltransferase [unclassified Luteipulveratus]MDE9364424.1 GNAT family N-acetyltransferase [Luteipulveratus sp. YIM 133132]MDF8263971.1 GNAT family N-acetyltransferase [Luteipulveratus sp. YIM 133296]